MVHQQRAAQAGLLLSAGLGLLAGLVMLGLGAWTVRDKAFIDQLLRNKLYMDAAYIILVASSLIILLSCFGCFAAMKEIKCFLLTYFVLLLLFTVVMMVSGVIAYVFREQVEWTMRAEMLTEVRGYRPEDPGDPGTRAWDSTQEELDCCGLLTDKVDEPWQMWRYNKRLNPSPPAGPGDTMLPASCCTQAHPLTLPDTGCRGSGPNVRPGDCLELGVVYVREQAATLGAAATAVTCLMVPGLVSSLLLFRAIA